MTTKTIFVTLFTLFIAFSGPFLPAVQAADAPPVAICAASDLSPDAKQATTEFARVLAISLGLPSVPVVAQPPASGTTIWVGRPQGLQQAFPNIDLATPGNEEVLIAINGSHIAILGNDQSIAGVVTQDGTELALYTFMQRNLGVRWFWPGDLGEEIPTLASLQFKNEIFRYTPQIHGRGLRLFQATRMLPKTTPKTDPAYIEALAYDKPIDAWATRNRLGGSFKMVAGHAFVTWYDQFSKTNPDYFALQPDGTRTAFPAPKTAKMCVSNPAVTKQLIADALKTIDNRPSLTMVSASENDSSYSGYCTCPECLKWDAQDAPKITLKWKGIEEPRPALTDRYAKFWNRVAQELRKERPNTPIDVGAWAYGAMRTPPVSTSVDPAVIIGFVGNLSWGGSAARKADLDLWDAWSKKVPRLAWRPNLFHYGWAMPGAMIHGLSEDFKFMADRGLIAMDIDSIYNDWATRGLDYYTLAQLAWDPKLNPDTLLADYCLRAFGPAAAPQIQAYFDSLEKAHIQIAQLKAGTERYGMVEIDRTFYTPERLAQWQAMLQAAQKTADADPKTSKRQRQRVTFLLDGLSFSQAQAAVLAAMEHVRSGNGDIRANLMLADKLCKERDALGQRLSTRYAIGYRQFVNQSVVRKMAKFFGPIDPEELARFSDPGITTLPARWAFQTDPQKQGLTLNWHKPGAATQGWETLSVNIPWGQQLKPQGPVDPDNPVDVTYLGDAWYRTTFTRPDLTPGQQLILEFPAIDKSCALYVNGTFVARQVYDAKADPDAWNKARRFDITAFTTKGENTLAVLVTSEFGQGGILKGAFLRKLNANLISAANLPTNRNHWATQFSDTDQPKSQTIPGMYVSELALRIQISQGTAGVQYGPGITLPAGKYTLAFISRVSVLTEKSKALLLRATLTSDDGSEPVRVMVKASGSGQWERSAAQFTLEKPMKLGALKFFLGAPGTFDLQDVELRQDLSSK